MVVKLHSRIKTNTSNLGCSQRYTYRVLQTTQRKLILLCVWAELAVWGSAKNALKFKYRGSSAYAVF